MNKLIEELNNKINDIREMCIARYCSNEELQPITDEIVKLAIEIYKDESIEFYIPLLEGNIEARYPEEDRSYVPIYFDTNNNKDNSIVSYKKVTFKELCNILYENIRTYADYEYINTHLTQDYLLTHLHEILEMKEYVNKNTKIDGIMYEPHTNHVFGFETWQIEAIIFKGMGVNSFHTFDPETGEKIHEI